MNLGGQVALILRQLREAAGRDRALSIEGSHPSVNSEMVHSLRLTLAALVQSNSSGLLPGRGLRLVAQPRGGIELRQGELLLPISEPQLRDMLKGTGLDLGPGQVLLLDPALARRIVEEALGAVSQEEIEVRGRKIRLLAASIGLEDPDLPNGSSKERQATPAA